MLKHMTELNFLIFVSITQALQFKLYCLFCVKCFNHHYCMVCGILLEKFQGQKIAYFLDTRNIQICEKQKKTFQEWSRGVKLRAGHADRLVNKLYRTMEEKSNKILSLFKLLQVTMQSFAYSTTGKLLWHKCIMIWWPKIKFHLNIISDTLNS